MKKLFCMMLVGIILCVACCGCGSNNNSYDDNDYSYSNDDNEYSYSNDYDYDKGYGYTAPEPGESFSDYVKRQDPDLYNDMQDRWDSLS